MRNYIEQSQEGNVPNTECSKSPKTFFTNIIILSLISSHQYHITELCKGIQKGASDRKLSQMKAFMNYCYSVKPEEYCLRELFDAAYFWN